MEEWLDLSKTGTDYTSNDSTLAVFIRIKTGGKKTQVEALACLGELLMSEAARTSDASIKNANTRACDGHVSQALMLAAKLKDSVGQLRVLRVTLKAFDMIFRLSINTGDADAPPP